MHKRPGILRFAIILTVALLIVPGSAGTYVLESSFGGPGTADGQFNNPFGIAVNESGVCFVADTNNNRIQVFTAEGIFVTAWGSWGIGDDQFMAPYAVAVNASGAVHVADFHNRKLKVFTSSGTHLSTHTFPDEVKGVAVDDAARTLCSDRDTDLISTYTSSYVLEGTMGSRGSGTGQFMNPTGIAVTATGVFVADTNNNRIQVYSKDGTFLDKWPSDITAGPAEGDFDHPYDVAVNRSGYLFVTDTGNNRVEIFSQAGDFVDDFSCPDPYGIATGPEDRVYVTSANEDRVYVYRIPPAPAVAGITPSSAIRGFSCMPVTVSGSDFQATLTVRLQKGATTIQADNITRLSAGTITCTLNLSSADAGQWDVAVINGDGKEGVFPGGFTITNPPPHIAAIAPDSGVSGEALEGIKITGSGFLPTPQVDFHRPGQPDLHAVDAVRINGTHITFALDLAGAAAGAWEVIVKNGDGQEDTLSGGFTVVEPAPSVPPSTPEPTETQTPEPTPSPMPSAEPTATPAPPPVSSGDGGPSSTAVAYAADLCPGENRTLNLASGALRSVTIRTAVPVDSVLVTAKECAIPRDPAYPNGTLYRCTEVTLYRIRSDEVEAVWFSFSLPASWFEEQGLSPEGVAMLRLHEGAWQDLPTRVVGTRNGMIWFQAESPGGSLLAIACREVSPSDTEQRDAESEKSRATPAPNATPAPSLQPDPDGTTAPTAAPQSPLAAAPLLSLPLALLLRRRP
jgi:PGF-pre-PGF domain-containing protein